MVLVYKAYYRGFVNNNILQRCTVIFTIFWDERHLYNRSDYVWNEVFLVLTFEIKHKISTGNW